MLTRRRRSEQKGQASIFLALLAMTFVGLFIFVVNTGLIVSAKINLQNAADLAAYAGAATQARQLNSIAFLNYEMRRQFKKFLFRYYVIGNMAQKSHSEDISGGNLQALRKWSPGGGAAPGFGVPVVCIAQESDNNFCQVSELRPLERIRSNPLDSISTTLRQQFEILETIRTDNCQSISVANELALQLWLYNTDPTLRQLRGRIGGLGNQAEFQRTRRALLSVEAISPGLGLIPKLIILAKRIDSLTEYINSPAKVGITPQDVQQLIDTPDATLNERTIQALLSAYYTLGGQSPDQAAADSGPDGHAFVEGSLQMDEILPRGQEGSDLIRLQKVASSFNAYYSDFRTTGAGQTCTQRPTGYSIKNLTVGFAKDPQVLTYYAVRLRALFKPLFFPRAPLAMKAYAAARPFGSRIGPSLSQEFFGRIPFSTPGRVPAGASPPVGDNTGIPNLPVFDGDGAEGPGWERNSVIRAYFEPIGIGAPTVNTATLMKATQAAMAPNPWEKGRYAIPNDANADPFTRYFDEFGFHSVWASIRSPVNFQDDPSEEIKDAVRQVVQGSGSGTAAISQDAFVGSIATYFDALSNPSSPDREDGEDEKVARLRDPITYTDIQGLFQAPAQKEILLNFGVSIRDANDLKTSWSDVKHLPYRQQGRVGYSVKFVPLTSLASSGGESSDLANSVSWSNVIRDAEALADLANLKH